MNKFSVVLPRFYPQSREGQITYAKEQVIVKPNTSDALKVYNSRPEMRAARQPDATPSIVPCNSPLYLSFLSPGGKQLKHTPVRDADISMRMTRSLRTQTKFERTQTKFEHWYCKQQAFQCYTHTGYRFTETFSPASRKDFLTKKQP